MILKKEWHKEDIVGIQSEQSDLRNLVTAHNLKIMCRSSFLEAWSTPTEHRCHPGAFKKCRILDSTQARHLSEILWWCVRPVRLEKHWFRAQVALKLALNMVWGFVWFFLKVNNTQNWTPCIVRLASPHIIFQNSYFFYLSASRISNSSFIQSERDAGVWGFKQKREGEKIDPLWEAGRAGKLPVDSVLENKAFVLCSGLGPLLPFARFHLAWQLSWGVATTAPMHARLCGSHFVRGPRSICRVPRKRITGAKCSQVVKGMVNDVWK